MSLNGTRNTIAIRSAISHGSTRVVRGQSPAGGRPALRADRESVAGTARRRRHAAARAVRAAQPQDQERRRWRTSANTKRNVSPAIWIRVPPLTSAPRAGPSCVSTLSFAGSAPCCRRGLRQVGADARQARRRRAAAPVDRRRLRVEVERRERLAGPRLEPIGLVRPRDLLGAALAVGLGEDRLDAAGHRRGGEDVVGIEPCLAGDVVEHRLRRGERRDEHRARHQRLVVVLRRLVVADQRRRPVDREPRGGRRHVHLARRDARRREADRADAPDRARGRDGRAQRDQGEAGGRGGRGARTITRRAVRRPPWR